MTPRERPAAAEPAAPPPAATGGKIQELRVDDAAVQAAMAVQAAKEARAARLQGSEEAGPNFEPEPEPEPPASTEARGVAFRVTRTLATVACCVCGAPIDANPLTMCGPCIATHGNITRDLPSRSELNNCHDCDRYLLPPKQWVVAGWESRELMAVCLKKIRGLNKLKLVDASFIWTEPHSKRVKVKITVQDDVYSGTGGPLALPLRLSLSRCAPHSI